MSSAGKWVLGLLLLVVGAVFVARAVSSDPGSQAELKEFVPVASAKESAKKADGPATDVACKKACIEVQEIANDSVTTGKLAPGSVTLSKLAFEVPNLNELTNEINARKAAEAATKAAQAEAFANGLKNDAAITAAANNGITQEAAARTAADEDLAKKFAAGDADLLSKLNKEVADRGAGDDGLQLKLNTEIADRAGAIAGLRGELGNPNQVASPIVQINNNEIVGDAVTSNKILDRTITAADLGIGSVTTVEILNGTIKGEDVTTTNADGLTGANVKDESLNAVDLNVDSVDTSEIASAAVKTDELAGLSVTTAKLAGTDVAATTTGVLTRAVTAAALADNAVITRTLSDGAVTFAKLDLLSQGRITTLETGLAAEIIARGLDVDAEELARATFDSSLATDAPSAVTVNGAKAPNPAVATEGLVDWSRLRDVPTDFADNKDDDGSNNINTFANELDGDPTDTTINETTGANKDDVSWFKLRDVPLEIADGDDNVDGGNAADLTCGTAGCVDATDLGAGAVGGRALAGGGTEIVQGSIVGEAGIGAGASGTGDIALGTITGQVAPTAGAATGNLALQTVGLANLAPDSVDADKIVNGSITKDELANGSVITDKLLVNFAKGDDTVGPVAPLGLPFVEVPAGNTKIVTTDTVNHNIMVSGQTQLTCGACAAATDNVVVQYQLVRTDDTLPTPTTTVIGPVYEVTLNAPTTVSLSLLDTNVPADTYVYKIRLARSGGTAGTTFTATKTVLNVVDQGRFQAPAS